MRGLEFFCKAIISKTSLPTIADVFCVCVLVNLYPVQLLLPGFQQGASRRSPGPVRGTGHVSRAQEPDGQRRVLDLRAKRRDGEALSHPAALHAAAEILPLPAGVLRHTARADTLLPGEHRHWWPSPGRAGTKDGTRKTQYVCIGQLPPPLPSSSPVPMCALTNSRVQVCVFFRLSQLCRHGAMCVLVHDPYAQFRAWPCRGSGLPSLFVPSRAGPVIRF